MLRYLSTGRGTYRQTRGSVHTHIARYSFLAGRTRGVPIPVIASVRHKMLRSVGARANQKLTRADGGAGGGTVSASRGLKRTFCLLVAVWSRVACRAVLG